MSELEKKDEQKRVGKPPRVPQDRRRRRRDHRPGRGLGGLRSRLRLAEETTTTTAAAGDHHHGRGRDHHDNGRRDHHNVSAAAEMGREIKIGAVSPITGSLASFGGPDKWIVSYVAKAIGDGVVCGDGKKHPITIIQLDTQSSPNRAAEVTGDLIFNEKVDMMVASSSPDTVNPAADQCEANGVPFLANFVPWQPFFFGRGATPDTPFTWTWMYHFGVEDAAECRLGMWDQVETNKKVGSSSRTTRTARPGRTTRKDSAHPGQGRLHDRRPSRRCTSRRRRTSPRRSPTSRRPAARSAPGSRLPGLHQLLAAVRAAGVSAEDPEHRAKPRSSTRASKPWVTSASALSDHMVWHPKFPYKSYSHRPDLPGIRRRVQRRDRPAVDSAAGPVGQVRVGCRRAQARYRHREQRTLRRHDQDHQVRWHQRPGRLQLAVTRPGPPGAERLQDQDRRWPVGQSPRIRKFKYDIYICFGQDPNMPIQKKFEVITYA